MDRHTRRYRALLASTGLLLALALPAVAQVEPRDAARRAYALSSDLMSPFCPGRTLQDCPSPDAAAVRDQIRLWVDAGLPDSEIRERLESTYGGQVLGVPRSAFGWITPIVLLLLGLGLLALALRRSVRRAPVDAAGSLDPDQEAALLAELEQRG